MFRLLGKVPKHKFTLACSGGKDSMTFLNFLTKHPKNDFDLAYFNHGTEHGNEAEMFLTEFAKIKKLSLRIGRIQRDKRKDESPEEYWRNERYSFLETIQHPVLTGQHLSDVVETWVFSSLRGCPKLIPYARKSGHALILRPFLMVAKVDIDSWAKKHDVTWIEDPSNSDIHYTRNLIRKELIPLAFRVNPGLDTMIRKKLLERQINKSFADNLLSERG